MRDRLTGTTHRMIELNVFLAFNEWPGMLRNSWMTRKRFLTSWSSPNKKATSTTPRIHEARSATDSSSSQEQMGSQETVKKRRSSSAKTGGWDKNVCRACWIIIVRMIDEGSVEQHNTWNITHTHIYTYITNEQPVIEHKQWSRQLKQRWDMMRHCEWLTKLQNTPVAGTAMPGNLACVLAAELHTRSVPSLREQNSMRNGIYFWHDVKGVRIIHYRWAAWKRNTGGGSQIRAKSGSDVE